MYHREKAPRLHFAMSNLSTVDKISRFDTKPHVEANIGYSRTRKTQCPNIEWMISISLRDLVEIGKAEKV